MKTLLLTMILSLSGSLLAKDAPTMITLAPTALEHLTRLHRFMSDSGSKYISIQLTNGTGGTKTTATGDSLSYNLKYESLLIGGWPDVPSDEPISIRIGGVEFRTNQEVLERLRVSTIELMQVVSSDGEIDEVVLVLRPSAPILVTRYEKKKKVEQAGTGQPATRSESKSESNDKPQPEAEGRSR